MKALARDAADRYASLEDMMDDLARLQGTASPARPEGEATVRAAALVEQGRSALARGDADRALDLAREALARAPEDVGGRALLRDAEAEALQRRVERELSDIRAEAARARHEGRLQQALGLCRKILELNPDDAEVARLAAEVEAAMRDRDVEQLSGTALAYAADGDVELALKIADKISRLAPDSAKSRELRAYLEEQAGRRASDALVATAQDHLALGNLNEARAAAEEALAASPSNTLAREIRDRAGSILAARRLAEVEPVSEPAPPARPEPAAPTAAAPAAVSAQEPVVLTPLPEGPPRHPEAGRALDAARRLLRERSPDKALPLLEEAAGLEPDHPGIQRLLTLTRLEARKAEAEALTNAALDHFMRNEYKKARATVERALSLQPADRKAQELKTLLATLLA
jgi:tetratricopeptide (TPR) repeat protein